MSTLYSVLYDLKIYFVRTVCVINVSYTKPQSIISLLPYLIKSDFSKNNFSSAIKDVLL